MSDQMLPPSPFIREQAELYFSSGGLRILDVGCFQGRNANYLATLGHHVTALTRGLDDLKVAREHAVELNVTTQFLEADARSLPFRSGVFDLVICNEVLYQIPHNTRDYAVSEIQRVTCPGGVNLVSDYRGDKENAVDENWLKERYSSALWSIPILHFDEGTEIPVGTHTELTSKTYLAAVNI